MWLDCPISNLKIRPKPGLEDNIVYINHAFNPMFHRINKSWENVELFFRIDDTGFLPLMMKRIWYEVTYDGDLTNEYNSIIPSGTVNMSGAGNDKSAYSRSVQDVISFVHFVSYRMLVGWKSISLSIKSSLKRNIILILVSKRLLYLVRSSINIHNL